MGKAAGTGARELSTGGQGARRDEGRRREGAVRMVRRSRSRKLQKLTGLCRREEGLRVRGEGGEARWGAARWQPEVRGGVGQGVRQTGRGNPQTQRKKMAGSDSTELGVRAMGPPKQQLISKRREKEGHARHVRPLLLGQVKRSCPSCGPSEPGGEEKGRGNPVSVQLFPPELVSPWGWGVGAKNKGTPGQDGWAG